MSVEEKTRPGWKRFVHTVIVFSGAFVLALSCFLVLPLLQAITKTAKPDLELRSADTAELPPPPPPETEQEEPDDPEPPPPPELNQESPPLDLSQLEMALDPGFGGGGFSGSAALSLASLADVGGSGIDELFDFSGLEEQPRPVFKHRPEMTAAMRKQLPCTVYILMTVTKDGKVVNPTVHRSDNRLFDAAALAAIKKWKFEPGRRNGKPDNFKVRQPITFK